AAATITGQWTFRDLRLEATRRLYFDGGGNTYIQESSSDRLRMVVGGGERFAITATSAEFGSGVNVSIPASLSVTGAITENGVRVAKVVISSSSPSGTYPHGTLWCRV